MSGVNKAIVVGHLGRDPDIRKTGNGNDVATFSVATSESWRDKATGERRQHTDWHKVVVFNEHLIKGPVQYLKKGSKVYVEGAMKTRKWTDQGGVERYVTEIVLSNFHSAIALLGRAPGTPAPEEDAYGSNKSSAPSPAGSSGKREDIDDEILF